MLMLLVVLIPYTKYSSALSLGTAGVCQKTNNNNIKFLECCQGYKFNQMNQKCDDCPAGTFGHNCERACYESFFGLRCKYSCDCKGNETCHKVHGCTVIKNTDAGMSGTLAKDLKGSTDTQRLAVTQRPTVTQRPIVTHRQVSIAIIAIVSSGCTAVFLIIVLIVKNVLCKNQCIGRGVNTNEANIELNEQSASLQEQSFVFLRNSIPESKYETIDESKMLDISNIKTKEDESTIRNSHTSGSSTDSNLSKASGVASDDIEGYVHPYNTLEEDWQSKKYQYNSCIVETKKRGKLHSFVVENNANPNFKDQTIDESNIKSKEDESTIYHSHTSRSSSATNLSVGSGVASEDIEGYVHPYNTLEEN